MSLKRTVLPAPNPTYDAELMRAPAARAPAGNLL
jgi:hypothetical protein